MCVFYIKYWWPISQASVVRWPGGSWAKSSNAKILQTSYLQNRTWEITWSNQPLFAGAPNFLKQSKRAQSTMGWASFALDRPDTRRLGNKHSFGPWVFYLASMRRHCCFERWCSGMTRFLSKAPFLKHVEYPTPLGCRSWANEALEFLCVLIVLTWETALTMVFVFTCGGVW